MFLSLDKYIIKFISIFLIGLTVLQILTYSPSIKSSSKETKHSNQTSLIFNPEFQNSSGMVENNLKKITNSSYNENIDSFKKNIEKIIFTDEVEKSFRIKLLYTLKITNKINLLKLSTNHLDLRSPPLSFS
jgi:uncharacterized membrane protein YhiD involved in acid resistance